MLSIVLKRALAIGALLISSAIPIVEAVEFPGSWNSTRNHTWKIFKDNRFDQYCGCEIGKGNKPDWASCGYEPRKQPKRASRIEMEHVVPAENLGRQFACWKEGGREHCYSNDLAFRNAHNDLHNVIPVIGEVNGDRSNYRFDEIPDDYGQYGACQFKVDFATRRAEPPPHMKGDIARIHLYMSDVHHLRLSSQQERLFGIWSRQDPVSQWEKLRDDRIYQIQGNRNHYVSGGPKPAAQPRDRTQAILAKPASDPVISQAANSAFNCERKTCSAMSSCEEAMYHLNVCGNKRLDGNSSGVPCQAICK